MLFVVPVVLFDMLKAKQLACVSESGQKCPAARSLSLRRAWIEITICVIRHWNRTRRSPYGERGLKCLGCRCGDFRCGRSPYGERGLKYLLQPVSHRGLGRSPYGERGLKFVRDEERAERYGRSPYGERGLK